MIIYDELAGRREELPVGRKLHGKRFTEVTLTQKDVRDIVVGHMDYLYAILNGFRPKEPE